VLLEELRRYRADLLDRPRLVVGSRADLVEGQTVDDDPTTMHVSAVTGAGVAALAGRLGTLVTEARAEEPPSGAPVIHRPGAEGVVVKALGAHEWRVLGRPAERAVALSDLTVPGAMDYAQGRLRRLGVGRALHRAGAREGDVVWIGDLSFDYEPDQL
jgi:GTP-binding protein